MKYQTNDVIIGKVIKVRPYALFINFEGVNGLLHISEISDHYVRDIEKFATIGDEIKVKVLSIDEKNGFLRVSYKQIDEKDRYCSHDSSLKRIPEANNNDFSLLAEKLPQWIESTLKKARNKND